MTAITEDQLKLLIDEIGEALRKEFQNKLIVQRERVRTGCPICLASLLELGQVSPGDVLVIEDNIKCSYHTGDLSLVTASLKAGDLSLGIHRYK